MKVELVPTDPKHTAKVWPDEMVTVPRYGDLVAAADGTVLTVIRIVHAKAGALPICRCVLHEVGDEPKL